ncbi:MAG TPA: DNA-primase RepB domain-containing protein, partial [Nitrososphaera sp.]
MAGRRHGPDTFSRGAMLVSKSELRKQFFEKLWKDHEGIACLATTDQPNPKASFKQHFFKWPTEHGRIEQFFLYNEQRKNIYFCINLLSKMERRKEFCLKSDVLWADLDDADVTQFEDSNFLPTILVESSPGKHQAYWCLQSELPPYQAEDYSRRLAYKYGADRSGWDLTQLLRVPFTKNLKYEDRPPITIKHMLNAVAPPALFEQLPSMFLEPTDSDIPTDDSPTAEEVIYKYGV